MGKETVLDFGYSTPSAELLEICVEECFALSEGEVTYEAEISVADFGDEWN